MNVDPTEPFVKYAVLIDNADKPSLERLQEDAIRIYGDPWGLSLRDFFALIEGDMSYIGLEKKYFYKATVRQYIWLKAFHACEARVAELLNAWQIPQSADAQKASAKCLKMGAKEAVIIFVRRYFGLSNFDATMDIPLSDFVLAKKDEFNNGIFQYAMNEIQRQNFLKK